LSRSSLVKAACSGYGRKPYESKCSVYTVSRGTEALNMLFPIIMEIVLKEIYIAADKNGLSLVTSLFNQCANSREYKMIRRNRSVFMCLALATLLGVTTAGCSKMSETYQRGYLLDESALANVKKGMGADQVLQTLGTPSTVSTVGNKTWYYISQTSHRSAPFMPEVVDDRRVTAVYFNTGMRVERTALYGLQDGKVFDFITRSTQASGVDQNFVGQLFQGLTRFDPISN